MIFHSSAQAAIFCVGGAIILFIFSIALASSKNKYGEDWRESSSISSILAFIFGFIMLLAAVIYFVVFKYFHAL